MLTLPIIRTPPRLLPTAQEPRGRILFADDDEDLRILLAVHLRRCGYDVVEFQDGEGLLDYIGALMMRNPSDVRHSDTVILDVRMPGFSGLQILTSLRRAGWKNPIVIETALRQGIESAALNLGATALIFKPFDVDAVVNMLQELEHYRPTLTFIDGIGQ